MTMSASWSPRGKVRGSPALLHESTKKTCHSTNIVVKPVSERYKEKRNFCTGCCTVLFYWLYYKHQHFAAVTHVFESHRRLQFLDYCTSKLALSCPTMQQAQIFSFFGVNWICCRFAHVLWWPRTPLRVTEALQHRHKSDICSSLCA